MMMTRRGGSARYVCTLYFCPLFNLFKDASQQQASLLLHILHMYIHLLSEKKNEVFKLIFSFLFCGEKVGSTSSKTKCTTCYITRMQVTRISLFIILPDKIPATTKFLFCFYFILVDPNAYDVMMMQRFFQYET